MPVLPSLFLHRLTDKNSWLFSHIMLASLSIKHLCMNIHKVQFEQLQLVSDIREIPLVLWMLVCSKKKLDSLMVWWFERCKKNSDGFCSYSFQILLGTVKMSYQKLFCIVVGYPSFCKYLIMLGSAFSNVESKYGHPGLRWWYSLHYIVWFIIVTAHIASPLS